MKDSFSAPDRRQRHAGPAYRAHTPVFKSPLGAQDGERVTFIDRRASNAPADRRLTVCELRTPGPARRISAVPFGRRAGDAERAKAAGRYVPSCYLKAPKPPIATQPITEVKPLDAPADRRTVGSMTSANNRMRREGQRRKTTGDRRKVRMYGAPTRRIGNGTQGRRVTDKTSYATLPFTGKRYDQRDLSDQSPGVSVRSIVAPAAVAKKDERLTLSGPRQRTVYEGAVALADVKLAGELVDLIDDLTNTSETTARSSLRAALLAVTARIEQREKNA